MANTSIEEFRPDQENVAYIGAGVTIKGEISVPDLIVVDGTVEGAITARVVSVGQTGVVRGNISATDADVSGSVADQIDIKQLLIIRSSGRVEGTIRYGEIELEKGAVVAGNLSATDDFRAVSKSSNAKASASSAPAPTPVAASAAQEADEDFAPAERINRAVRTARGVVTPLRSRKA